MLRIETDKIKSSQNVTVYEPRDEHDLSHFEYYLSTFVAFCYSIRIDFNAYRMNYWMKGCLESWAWQAQFKIHDQIYWQNRFINGMSSLNSLEYITFDWMIFEVYDGEWDVFDCLENLHGIMNVSIFRAANLNLLMEKWHNVTKSMKRCCSAWKYLWIFASGTECSLTFQIGNRCNLPTKLSNQS